MKSKWITVLCVAAAVVMTVAAVCIGAVRGWGGEQEKVLSAFTEDSSLHEYLDTRAMDAANLIVVASRHLPADDATLTKLQMARSTLLHPEASVMQLSHVDAVITEAAKTLAETLPKLDSVKASSRDQAYITTLTRTLSAATDVTSAYDTAVKTFNERMNGSFTGMLAKLFGVGNLAPAAE